MPATITDTSITDPRLAFTINNIFDAVKPFHPGDYSKGTYLTARIAGLTDKQALKALKHAPAVLDHWIEEPNFKRIYDEIPYISEHVGQQARVVRAAQLDALLVECGIQVCSKILEDETLSAPAWNFATKMADLRIPVLMSSSSQSGGPYDKLRDLMGMVFGAPPVNQEVTLEQEVTTAESTTRNKLQLRTLQEEIAAIEEEVLSPQGPAMSTEEAVKEGVGVFRRPKRYKKPQ